MRMDELWKYSKEMLYQLINAYNLLQKADN